MHQPLYTFYWINPRGVAGLGRYRATATKSDATVIVVKFRHHPEEPCRHRYYDFHAREIDLELGGGGEGAGREGEGEREK